VIVETRALAKIYPGPRMPRRRSPGADEAPSSHSANVALKGLDLEIGAGECFGLLGPNGAGKTTTVGILTTRVRPTSGRASIDGLDVTVDPAKVKRRIGVVPQRPNADRKLTVEENLTFHAAYFGIDSATARARAETLLTTFELADRARSRVDQLSGGQQQRLMIARALIHEPQVLFLDEPTLGLDPHARLALWDILRSVHARGTTILLTTHYMEEADRLCDRVAIIDRGELLALDTPARLKARAPGGTLVELRLDGDATGVAAAARAVPGVIESSVEAETLRVYVERPGEALSALVLGAEHAGRRVLDVHLAAPSLETLFLSLTGRKLA
jgi:ABC-2 type transport system ATP-binding protein